MATNLQIGYNSDPVKVSNFSDGVVDLIADDKTMKEEDRLLEFLHWDLMLSISAAISIGILAVVKQREKQEMDSS